MGRNYILSVRSGAEKGFHDVRIRCENEPELLSRDAGYVLYALMDAVVDRYFPELNWRYGYAATLAVMAGIDGYLLYRLRKAKWL